MNFMSKKNYVKSAKVGDVLNQAALKDFKDQSNNSNVEFNGIDYKIETIGTISSMKYSKNFEDQVLSFMKEIKTDVKDIKSRLVVLEDDVKVLKEDVNILKEDVNQIKSLPTIRGHLNGTIKKEEKLCQRKQKEESILH